MDKWKKAAELSSRMFAIDSELSREAANRNHNLAHALKLYARLSSKPDKLKRAIEKFDPVHWLERFELAAQEVEALDPGLTKEVQDWLQGFNPDTP